MKEASNDIPKTIMQMAATCEYFTDGGNKEKGKKNIACSKEIDKDYLTDIEWEKFKMSTTQKIQSIEKDTEWLSAFK